MSGHDPTFTVKLWEQLQITVEHLALQLTAGERLFSLQPLGTEVDGPHIYRCGDLAEMAVFLKGYMVCQKREGEAALHKKSSEVFTSGQFMALLEEDARRYWADSDATLMRNRAGLGFRGRVPSQAHVGAILADFLNSLAYQRYALDYGLRPKDLSQGEG